MFMRIPTESALAKLAIAPHQPAILAAARVPEFSAIERAVLNCELPEMLRIDMGAKMAAFARPLLAQEAERSFRLAEAFRPPPWSVAPSFPKKCMAAFAYFPMPSEIPAAADVGAAGMTEARECLASAHKVVHVAQSVRAQTKAGLDRARALKAFVCVEKATFDALERAETGVTAATAALDCACSNFVKAYITNVTAQATDLDAQCQNILSLLDGVDEMDYAENDDSAAKDDEPRPALDPCEAMRRLNSGEDEVFGGVN